MKKKLIALLLAISASFSLASCDMSNLPIIGGMFDKESSSSGDPAKTYDLEGAKKLLDSRIKGLNADSNEDYDLPKDILFGGETYTLTWSVNATENVEIVVEKDGSVWVDVNEALVEEFSFVLTAKITAPDGTSVNADFNRKIKPIERYVPVAITAKPVEGTAYKLSAYNPGKAADLYLNKGVGARDYYLKTATEYDQGVDVFAEHVEGSTEEFYLYYNIDAAEGATAKQYLKLAVEGDKVRSYLSETPFAFKFSAEYGVYCAIGETICVFGTESGYDSISGTTYPVSGVMSPAYLITKLDRSQVSAEDKLKHEKDSLKLAPMYIGGGDDAALVMHGTRFPDVKITWESNNENLTINRKTMSFAAVTETVDVTLTATLEIGGKKETKPVTVKVVANNATAILAAAEALEHNQAFGNEVTLTGTMLRFVAGKNDDGTYTEQYESITFMMSVDGKEVEGYRMKGLTTEAKDAKPGDILTCKGELLKYYDTLEFSFGKIIKRVEGELPDDGGNGGNGGNTETTGTSINIENYATANNWATNTLYESVAASDYTVTISATPVGTYAQNTGKYYTPSTSNPYHSWRMYQNENPSIVVSAVSGKYITSIKITYVSEKTGVLLLNGAQVVSDTVVTASANSVTFNVGNTTTETKGQVRITAIEVICAEGTGTGTVTPPAGGDQGGTDTPTNPNAPAKPDFSGTLYASVPAVGTGYAFGMTQANCNNAIYYLAGGMSGYYMATTTTASDAIATYIEETTGGYYFYTYVNGVKTYINMAVSTDGEHVNGAYEATASTVYTIDETHKTLIASINGEDYWFGTRNDKDYTTMGPCKVSYNGFNGVFYGVEEGTTPPAGGNQGGTGNEGGNSGNEGTSWTPAENVAYAFYLTQKTLNENYYFTGAKSGNYLTTSVDVAASVAVYVEATDVVGKYKLYFMNGETKTYITINSSQKADLVTDATSAVAFTYSIENNGTTYNCWYATIGSENYYLGTYTLGSTNYTTIGASKTSYLWGDNAATQYPAIFMTVEEAAALDATNSQKVSTELSNVTIDTEITGAKSINLVTKGKKYVSVTVSYAVTEGNTVASIVDGKLVTVNPDADTTIKVVATLKSGTFTETKEFVITVKRLSPEQAPVTVADFNTLTKTTSYGTYTTTDEWVAVNACVQTGGTSNNNPVFTCIGDESTKAVCLNGKTSTVGKLTSPTLTTGVSKISFNYANNYSESNGVDITINVKNANGEVVATTTLEKASADVAKNTAYEFEWTLTTAVTVDCTIEVVNNCPSNTDGNKDRVALWNFTVTGVKA